MPEAKTLRPRYPVPPPNPGSAARFEDRAPAGSGRKNHFAEGLEDHHPLLHRTDAMMQSTDSRGQIADVSARWLDVMGYGREEVIGCRLTDFLTPKSRLAMEVSFAASPAADTYDPAEYQFVTKGGEIRDMLISRVAEGISDGTEPGSLDVLVDVTDQRRTQRALAESEALHRAVLQDQTELICRCRPDASLIFVNQAFCRYFGKSESELIGTAFTDLFPAESAADLQAQFAGLRPGASTTRDHQTAAPDGRRTWQEWTHRGIAGADGGLIEVQSVGRDIMPSRRQQRTLRRLHEITASHSLAPDEQIDAMIRLGLDHFGLDCGIMSEIAGGSYVVRHAVGCGESIVSGTVIPLGETYCVHTLRRGGPLAFAHVGSSVLGQDPAYRQLGLEAYIAAPIPVDGRIRGTLNFSSAKPSPRGFGPDDLEMVALLAQWLGLQILTSERQEALRRSNAELEQFAHIASHDLQEPLRTVSGFCELLQQRYRGRLDREADEFIDFIVDGATRMQGLVRDLLAFSRVGTRGAEPKPIRADEVLTQTLGNLKAALEQHEVIVEREPLPTVCADQVQLVQLLQNLIGNAIKFRGPARPKIRIWAEDVGGEWRFAVADNGIGIEAKFAKRIFQVFQRLHPQKKIEGSGIGLSICKKIVERHNGRIWFESEVDKGSTFFFTLPKPD